jgi:hypothetical protein
MAKQYGLVFGSGDPRSNTGLTPTFVLFYNFATGATLPPPGISETMAGSGYYNFSYNPTFSIAFLADGGAGLDSSSRYISSVLDPIQAVDEKTGYITDSFGSTSIDPTTILGFLKRMQEFLEGNKVFTKSTGLWDVYSRGSTTLLVEKTLSDTTSQSTST